MTVEHQINVRKVVIEAIVRNFIILAGKEFEDAEHQDQSKILVGVIGDCEAGMDELFPESTINALAEYRVNRYSMFSSASPLGV